MLHGDGLVTDAMPVGEFLKLLKFDIKNNPNYRRRVLKGEISQWKPYPSGHTYFNLRDDQGQISCVIWKNRCRIPSSIENGSEVLIIADLDFYNVRGQIQLIVERIEPVSRIGALEEAKRKLVEKLRNEGVFERQKKPLPLIPKHIALVTGWGSAALSDMKRIMENRWPGLRCTVIGVLVQGDLACDEITRGIELANSMTGEEWSLANGQPPVDVIIAGRGGGSPEDLWAFNLEPVARALQHSLVPTVSAVGHESDVMVSDWVADHRASTPSNAIEMVVPIKNDLLNELFDFEMRSEHAVNRSFADIKNHLLSLRARLQVAPMQGLSGAKEKVLQLSNRLDTAVTEVFSSNRNHLARQKEQLFTSFQAVLATEKSRLSAYSATLSSTNPKRVLNRGYTMVQSSKGEVLTSVTQLVKGGEINLNFSDGKAQAEVTKLQEEEK